MEENIFYVKPSDSTPRRLPEDLIYEIKIDDINELALYATTLEPEPEITEVDGYGAALYTYAENNNNKLSECYKQITSDQFGSQFLSTTISLFLIEKNLRKNGINEKMLTLYSKIINDYQKQLKFNAEEYQEQQTTRRAK